MAAKAKAKRKAPTAAVEATERPPVRDALGMPIIALEGGPYDGDFAMAGDPELRISFFPDKVIALGEDGSAVYLLEDRDDGKVGIYSHMG